MNGCLKCGGTLKMANGKPCPDCASEIKVAPIVQGIPMQYQGTQFDRKFLPEKEQGKYGTFMEELLTTIVNDIAFYQKNMLICSRPNSGKTLWAFNIITVLNSKGFNIPVLKDIAEVRGILNSYNIDEVNTWSTARVVFVKLPRDMAPWMFDTISYLVERRVRSDGFTVFLYSGKYEELKQCDKYDRLKDIIGNGAYNTIKVESF